MTRLKTRIPEIVFTVTSFETLSIRTHSRHPEGAFRPKDLSDS
jgi:hypothetical protein